MKHEIVMAIFAILAVLYAFAFSVGIFLAVWGFALNILGWM